MIFPLRAFHGERQHGRLGFLLVPYDLRHSPRKPGMARNDNCTAWTLNVSSYLEANWIAHLGFLGRKGHLQDGGNPQLAGELFGAGGLTVCRTLLGGAQSVEHQNRKAESD